ncbi:hypothetical protein ROHU_021573 [Labeo rohita]|uniref:Uncharacterized protein n=1 Tax=Labeo rohita TaxID=84645 RepID=A0A498MX11_LABRO|nr:hypothetical protein ROHU_021573 [Labeo rohita]
MFIIINVTCAEIQSAVGFLYVIQSVVLNQTLNADCEQSWCSQSHFRHVTIFRDQLLWIFAVFIIVVLIIIFIYFLWRKKKLRCFLNVFQCSDSENRCDCKH